MLDFRHNSARRDLESRQERRYLLMLVLFLGITIILIDWAREPAIWRLFDLMLSPPQDAGGGAVDNRLDEVARAGSFSDSFVAAADDDKPVPLAKPVPLDDKPVPPEAFAAVQDDTPSTHNDREVSLRLLDILNRTDMATLRKRSVGSVTYAQLFRQPNQYRGRLVTVSGIVRRANRLEIAPNQFGIKQYYQVWLWPSDNPTAPIVVYCLRLPKGFPTGMEFVEEAEVTGFFFKRWAYMAKDSLRTAPTLLAKTLQWQTRPDMAPPALKHTWAIPLAVCTAVAFALLTTLYVYFRTRLTRPVLPDRPPNFDVLRDLDQNK